MAPPPLKRRLVALATRTEREVLALWRRHQSGLIDRDAFVELAAMVIGRARAQGVLLADLGLASSVASALGEVASPLGVSPPDRDIERLQGSVGTVLAAEVKSATTPEEIGRSQGLRLARLARDAPADALTWAMGIAMVARASEGVQILWTRSTDLDPCQMCRNLADGIPRPPSIAMKRHTGCMCLQQTVIGR